MGWKLGVPARALPSLLRLAGVHMGVACGLIASSRRASQHRTDGRVAHCPARVHVYGRMWCTSTPYVVGSSCSHRTVIIAVCLSTAAHAPAEQQQQQQQEQRHSSNPRARSVRASPCLCAVPKVPIIPLITLAFRAGQAKDGVGAGPATRLGQLPHRPAGYSTSLRTPLALPFGAEKGGSGVSAKTSRAKACF